MISWVSMYDIICIIEPNATSSMSSAATSYMIEEVAADAFDKLNAIKKSVSNIQALFATVVMAGATIFATCLSLGLQQLHRSVVKPRSRVPMPPGQIDAAEYSNRAPLCAPQ